MPGGAREWKRVSRPSLSGIASLKRISSMSMLLISRTRSFTSQVSYAAGMIFAAGLGARARLGEEPWLELEVEGLEDVVMRLFFDGGGGVLRLVGI